MLSRSLLSFAIFSAWRVSRIIFRSWLEKSASTLRKYIRYQTVTRRIRGSTDVNIDICIYLLIYFVANATACVIKIVDIKDLGQRCSKLLIFNSIPLYAIGTKSVILNMLLNIEASDYQIIHRWIGRICVLESIIHSVCFMVEHVDVSKTNISVSTYNYAVLF